MTVDSSCNESTIHKTWKLIQPKLMNNQSDYKTDETLAEALLTLANAFHFSSSSCLMTPPSNISRWSSFSPLMMIIRAEFQSTKQDSTSLKWSQPWNHLLFPCKNINTVKINIFQILNISMHLKDLSLLDVIFYRLCLSMYLCLL